MSIEARRVPAGARPAPLALVAFLALATACTLAFVSGVIALSAFSASASEIGEGEVWLLASSAVVAQRPLALSLASLAALGVALDRASGWRVVWASALLGHVCSTLLTYGVLDLTVALDPSDFRRLLVAPDYGVSAIFAAWLGALAAHIWTRPGATRRDRVAAVAGTAAVALVAWAVRGWPTPDVLEVEHVFAFAIGVTVTWTMARPR